jgi:hypothetical protein
MMMLSINRTASSALFFNLYALKCRVSTDLDWSVSSFAYSMFRADFPAQAHSTLSGLVSLRLFLAPSFLLLITSLLHFSIVRALQINAFFSKSKVKFRLIPLSLSLVILGLTLPPSKHDRSSVQGELLLVRRSLFLAPITKAFRTKVPKSSNKLRDYASDVLFLVRFLVNLLGRS